MHMYILPLFHKIGSNFESSLERIFPLYLFGYSSIATKWINNFEIW